MLVTGICHHIKSNLINCYVCFLSFSYILYNPLILFVKLEACGLLLAACRLWLVAPGGSVIAIVPASGIQSRTLIPDPIHATATCFFWTGPQTAEVLDQGSVLDVRAFGSLSIYFAPQPEVVPINLRPN